MLIILWIGYWKISINLTKFSKALTERNGCWLRIWNAAIILDFIHSSICLGSKRLIEEIRSSIKDCCGRSSVVMNASPNIPLRRVGDIVPAGSESDEDATSFFLRA